MLNIWSSRKVAGAVTAALGVASMATLALACSRSVPASFPTRSAAAPDALEAPPAEVGVVLAGDPPLPGESNPGWPGLDSVAPAQGGQHHHHHGSPGPATPSPAAPDGGAHAHAH